jgi:RloB-like protein
MIKYLSRNKVYEKVEPQNDAKKIYIFCEGEDREVTYFKYFQGFSSNIDIIPIPNDKGKSDPVKLKENAELLFLSDKPKYTLNEAYKDEIWFVIDTDRWNEHNRLQPLKDFCHARNEIYYGWKIAQSNPSFELWLYYHFFDSKPKENDVKSALSFKEYVNQQITGGFDSRSMPIELQSAMGNSFKNFEIENNQPKLYSTEVHNLGTVILPFIKIQLDKAKVMRVNQYPFKK